MITQEKTTDDKIITVSVTPEYIKKNLKFNDTNILQINIKYPVIKISPSEIHKKTVKKINEFYETAVKYFTNFCETKLYKNAAVEMMADSDNNFKPFGAVMSYDVVYNKQDFLCVYLDINIYAGEGRKNAIRKMHTWELGNGELLTSNKAKKFLS